EADAAVAAGAAVDGAFDAGPGLAGGAGGAGGGGPPVVAADEPPHESVPHRGVPRWAGGFRTASDAGGAGACVTPACWGVGGGPSARRPATPPRRAPRPAPGPARRRAASAARAAASQPSACGPGTRRR